jgi:hypothetical protein
MRLNFDNLAALNALPIFDDVAVDFLDSLSRELIKFREYPDVATLGFWCRKANILKLKTDYPETDRIGRGAVFHIAPSNVAVNFAYSLIVGLLAGNANIVRLPSKDFPQVDIIRDAVGEHERIKFVRYGHEREVTDYLSSICAVRVIWGGDGTIAEIRESPLPPRSNEITFADRFSICVIDADKYLSECDPRRTARDFYNDTYLTDQNACTSPRIVVWFGRDRAKAKEIFWNALYERLGDYSLQPVRTVNKLSTLYRFAANADCRLSKRDDYKIMRAAVNSLTYDVTDNLENSGYFYEYDANSLDEILPVCVHKCQTLSYIGFDPGELQAFILKNAPHGVDRIVPVGKTMDFALVWDGVDLIRTMSRKISYLKS